MNAGVMSPVLVGRSSELAQLNDALAKTPGVVLIGGEAGVGKTRLLREFGGRARADGARLLVGGCLELGSDGLPYAPFTAVLRGLVRDIGLDGVAALLPGRTASGLARLLPEFGDPETDPNSGEARVRLFELVLTLLERLAEQAPTILLIEDAHWADRSTRDLLSFLVRNLGGAAALLIIVSYRTDELHRSHPLRPLLAELDRVDRVRRHELDRLSRAEVADLARSLIRAEPTQQLVDEIFTRSEGNPLFVEALMDDQGRVACALPESLRDLLLASVQRLPDETQDLLRVASAGGIRIDHALLAVVSGIADPALTRVLRPAVAANVLAVDGDGYAFRHALIREAVHDDLLPGEHTRLHTRYAEALEADPGLVPTGRASIEMAHHWHSAHNTTWALISAWRAAGDTYRAAAFAESLNMISRVLELWDLVPDAGERIEAEHSAVLEKAVEAADLAGESERGVKLATAALKEVHDDLRASSLLKFRGQMTMRLGRPADGIEDLREAARRVPVDPPSVSRARVLAMLARQLQIAPDPEAARRTAEAALLVARQVDDPTAEASSLLTLLCVDADSVDDICRLNRLDEVEVIARRDTGFESLLRVAINRSDILEGIGRHEEAATVARDGVRKAEHRGVGRVTGSFISINLAEPLFSLGRWDEALSVIRQALDQDPPPTYRSSLRHLAGAVALARGDLLATRAAVVTAKDLITTYGWRGPQDLFAVLRLEASLLLAEGRPAEALTAIEPVMTMPGLPDDSRYTWPVLVIAADAAGQVHDTAMQARIRERAAGLRMHSPVHEAHRLTLDAALARAEGADSPDLWHAAAAAWATLGQPYPQARTLTKAAEAAIAAGRRDDAAEWLHQAAELAAAVGANPLSIRIEAVSRRARLSDQHHAAPLGLTPRELEVLRLVTEGRSNREISAALYISAKTASVHVSNILAKLSVASRGEAAAIAHREGLY